MTAYRCGCDPDNAVYCDEFQSAVSRTALARSAWESAIGTPFQENRRLAYERAKQRETRHFFDPVEETTT